MVHYYNIGREITEEEFRKIAESNRRVLAEAEENGITGYEALKLCNYIVAIEKED